MERENVQSLIQTSGFFAFILIWLVGFSFVSEQFSHNAIIYTTAFLCSLTIFLLSRFVFRKSGKVILVLFYLLIIAAFVFGTFICNFGINKGVGTTFNVLLVAMPFLISDFAWRIDLTLLISSIVFLFFSYIEKDISIFRIDLVNVVCFLTLALYINTMQQIRRFGDYYHSYIIKRQRDIDPLTGLLNKTALELRIRALLSASNVHGALMILDMDNFKSVNDHYGHAVGDYVITIFGKCLENFTRNTDIVGRFGGDEFIIFFPDLNDAEELMTRAKELITEIHTFFAQTVEVEDVTVSIGCTVVTDNCRDYEILFNHIDKALYRAKAAGKNTCCLYEADVEKKLNN
ncbi:MAG: diguanylate cyclase [Treponema sp.]|nr:diguanylate cyclase [Treponema sp.]